MAEENKNLVLNYILKQLSVGTECVAIFAFASLISIPAGIANVSVGLKNLVIAARIKKHESVIKKEEKEKHNKIILLETIFDINRMFLNKNNIEEGLDHRNL